MPNSIKWFDEAIEQVNDVQFLGVVIDQHLTSENHVESILKRDVPFSRIFATKQPILMYNSFVLSKLNYCLEVLGNSADTHLNKLLLFQENLLRIIFQTHYLAPSIPLFEKSQILEITKLYRFKMLTHKMYYSSATILQPSHSYNTRSSTITLPVPQSTSLENFIVTDWLSGNTSWSQEINWQNKIKIT